MRYLYIGLGLLCLALGAVGAVLPILPTTPFLLVTAYCFARGSQRFHAWFLGTQLYHKHLESFVRERAMTRRSKGLILFYASLMLIIGFILSGNLIARIVILAVMAAKYYYFFRHIKTIPEKTEEATP